MLIFALCLVDYINRSLPNYLVLPWTIVLFTLRYSHLFSFIALSLLALIYFCTFVYQYGE